MSDGPLNEVRRRDRAREDDWIRDYLLAAPWGTLAMVVEDQPILNSNLFVYDPDEHALFLHTARTGRTPETLAEPRKVAFSVSAMGRLLPADEALEFSVEYSGVAVFGTARTLTDPEEKGEVLQKLLDKYAPHLRPGEDYRPITDDELKRTAVYRVDVEAWSGKEKVERPNFEGAFPLAELSLPFREADRLDGE